NPGEVLAAMTERATLGISFEEIVARTGWLENEISRVAKILAETGWMKIVSAEPLVLLSGKSFDEISRKIAARVEKFHKENPLLPGITREDLRSSLGRRVRPEPFRAALDDLLAQRKLETQGEIVKRAG